MNSIKGHIQNLQKAEELTFLQVQTAFSSLNVLSLDFKAALGAEVSLFFKENALVLLSLQNNAKGENIFKLKVKNFQKGELLAQVFFEQGLSSILTLKAYENLNLQRNDEVFAFVNPSDINIRL